MEYGVSILRLDPWRPMQRMVGEVKGTSGEVAYLEAPNRVKRFLGSCYSLVDVLTGTFRDLGKNLASGRVYDTR